MPLIQKSPVVTEYLWYLQSPSQQSATQAGIGSHIKQKLDALLTAETAEFLSRFEDHIPDPPLIGQDILIMNALF